MNNSRSFKIMWWLLCLTLSLGNLQRWLIFNVAIYFHEVLMLIFLSQQLIFNATGFWAEIKTAIRFLFRPTIFLLISFTIFSLGFNTVFGAAGLRPYLYLLRAGFYLLFGLGLVSLKRQKLLSQRDLFIGLSMFFLSITLFGLLQYFFLPDTRFLAVFGWDSHYYRLIATFLDPNFTGMILILGIIYFLTLKKSVHKLVLIATLLLMTLALGLTYSRISYLSFLAALSFLKWQRQINFWKFSLVIFLGALILWLPKDLSEGTKLTRTASVMARQLSFSQSLKTLTPVQWFIGRGIFTHAGQIDLSGNAQTEGNILVFILTTGGLIGTGLLSICLWQYRSSLKNLNPALQACLIGLIIHSLANATFSYNFVVLILMIETIYWTNLKTGGGLKTKIHR